MSKSWTLGIKLFFCNGAEFHYFLLLITLWSPSLPTYIYIGTSRTTLDHLGPSWIISNPRTILDQQALSSIISRVPITSRPLSCRSACQPICPAAYQLVCQHVFNMFCISHAFVINPYSDLVFVIIFCFSGVLQSKSILKREKGFGLGVILPEYVKS